MVEKCFWSPKAHFEDKDMNKTMIEMRRSSLFGALSAIFRQVFVHALPLRGGLGSWPSSE